jgi:hypothetical protein
MAVPDLNKPSCIWCAHAERPHGGCRVYDKPEKPQACTDFACLWLVSQGRSETDRMPDVMRPDRSGVVFHDARNGDNTLYVNVAPEHPEAWQLPMIKAHIDMVLDRGCKVSVIIGGRRIELEP